MTPTQMSRRRFKAMREGKPFDPPAIHVEKLRVELTAAANSNPAPVSRAERLYVETQAFNRYMELCRVAPLARRP